MKMLAFDFGASSGRGILGEIRDGKLTLQEVHRFSNDPVQLKNHLQWDFLRLIHEVKQCLTKCKNNGEEIVSIGVDTWGVDYGLLDGDGELMGNPFHYRDSRNEPMIEHCFKFISKEALITQSGLDCLPYNTIYQLLAETQVAHGPIYRAEQMLLMPDLFNYILTGQKRSEYSIATTTQLFDYSKSDWNYELLETLQLPRKLFAPVIYPGEIVGELTPEIRSELDLQPCKVISVGSHDTASAIAAIPAESEDFIFISTGTWVMVGVEA
ncbi:MAG: rhamnulokinase, partial [Vallitaleaceae bacterium]|nr:rhamnulokinase [Vallitaleaceae bacterium]